ncbi:MAG: hypothetical protein P0119_19015 [Nitrospira sp.]|nr:hypothetical protein [Nitrospira sp.]
MERWDTSGVTPQRCNGKDQTKCYRHSGAAEPTIFIEMHLTIFRSNSLFDKHRHIPLRRITGFVIMNGILFDTHVPSKANIDIDEGVFLMFNRPLY